MPEMKLMLIDGNSLLFRAFYALPLLHNREGVYTNGVYGFLTMFNRIIASEQPTHIAVAFDMEHKTFRSDRYSKYKANRSAPPEELQGQFQLLREVLDALNIHYIEKPGYEADDIIGTLSWRAQEENVQCLIVTGDGDALQLVSERVKVLMTKKGISDIEVYGPAQVREKWEVSPLQIIEIKGLMGDISDNIPGVPGVGAKTAVKLIKEYRNIENLYDHLHEVSGRKLVERLTQNRELAFISRELATIVRDVELDWDLEKFRVGEPNWGKLVELYKRLEFNHFLNALQENKSMDKEVNTSKINVIELETEEAAADFFTALKTGLTLAMYIETDYHHPMWAKIKGIYFEDRGNVYHLPIGERAHYRLEWVRPLLESMSFSKLVHNTKYLQVILMRYGINLRGVTGDTLLVAYIDDPSFEGDELSSLLYKYLKIKVTDKNPVILISCLRELFNRLQESIPSEQESLLKDIEMPISEVLAYMEFTGIKVDRETLQQLSTEMAGRIKESERKIFLLAGQEFNINSPKQLGKVLFEDLGLRVVKKTKTGYGTGAEVLEELYNDHEIIAHILNYRQLAKLKSTYVDALQELIHPDTGRVHTIFKQAQTATGRLSSVEPNLQNIPIKMEEGRRIRKAFTVVNEGYVLMSADYSQIDLRALAHISGDKTLIETFHQNIDIHARTAAEIFNVPLNQVDSELRRRAKAVNFGIIYGISDFGLARDTGVSRKEARRYIDNYLDSYPGVKKYMEDIVKFGQERGYVETYLKRRRYLPELNAKNKLQQSFARRMALNTPIQGTSADIIKLAMIKVFDQLRERELQAKLLLQVHDELVLEVPLTEVEEVAELLKYSMENACELLVPLEVSLKIGRNWYDMVDFKV
ncbi:MAG: DNA polymerase I [Syntrophomonadaceae bacterium]|jgi:DNA polymerase-1